ncbi:MAG: site-specific DNA-methyltransferase [Bdellovibrionales bacterium CG10_big_fil_rev_8_21_14_0_10_45_34]|nr:MAG: site-specific DNA-methyltransferase [Bdellovibrionales bacterium CG10_big_fil_rev_8_21_14_0_10_45_34]
MAKLTEIEQQEVARFIEAGKPLPDKYRFLLFEDKREVELVWNGKSNDVCNIVLPFQTIEQVDEPREEVDTKLQQSLFDIDSRGRQLRGWTNKLIWGDNKLILSSLKNGPLRDEIEKQGGLKLIYIDPPFDVGADFSMDIEIGDEKLTKKPSILEEIAYRDTWGKGVDSFVAMMHERLRLMRDLLSPDGSIFVHCDWRVSSVMDLVLAEVFGRDNFHNEIIWYYTNKYGANSQTFDSFHNTIYWYGRSKDITYNPIRIPVKEVRKQPLRKWNKELGKNEWQKDKDGNYLYVESSDKEASDVWEIPVINPMANERLGYPTQKPEALVERIINATTNEGDLVADFFCGSGTTAIVAERLKRKWIAADLGKFAIHTTRKRMIGVQRELKNSGEDYRAFEILNLGKYERQMYVGLNPDLREEQKAKQQVEKEQAFIDLILKAYKAEGTTGFKIFQGKKNGRLVAIGPVNMPVSRLFVEEIISECRQKKITKIDILGFEFEMGLFPDSLEEAKRKGIDIAPKYIPADVFDKRAVERNQVSFHDVAYIEAKAHKKKDSVAIELKDFSVFYSQDATNDIAEHLKNKASKVVIEQGQIVKIVKDAKGKITRERLTEKWSDWVDYWSVDFNYGSKKETIRTKNETTGDFEDIWTGDYIFENEWQSFRTKKDRSLELMSPFYEFESKTQKVAIKVVDIFGNDTMTVIELIGKDKK